MRRTAHALLVLLVLTGAAACGGGDEDEGAVADPPTTAEVDEPAAEGDAPDEGAAAGEGEAAGEVRIVDFAFEPAEVTVAAGTTVVWSNADEAIHSIADRELGFESEDLAQGDTFEHTYEEPGEHPYICGIHEYMKGTVVVE